jgi:hypothetical protein
VIDWKRVAGLLVAVAFSLLVWAVIACGVALIYHLCQSMLAH